MQATVTAKVIHDIKGQPKYYLVITNGQTQVYVNVGKRTHDGVQDLINAAEQPELPLVGTSGVIQTDYIDNPIHIHHDLNQNDDTKEPSSPTLDKQDNKRGQGNRGNNK